MRAPRLLSVLALSLLATPALLVPSASVVSAEGEVKSEIREAVTRARDKVYPALVNIAVVARQFVGGRERRAPGAGSGVIVSPAGHVVTNFHVAGDATRITCRMPDGEEMDADILCGDPFTDLCILKLRLDQRRHTGRPLPFASIGDSDLLQVGDYVLAMGNPRSLSSSVTLGIVSNTKRVFTSFTGDSIQALDLDGYQTGIFNQWLQHDALIQPGNSGGPLVNLRGEVIGINTRGGSGVGFAVPSTTVRYVLNQALTFGEPRVRRSWVGLAVVPVKDLDREDGALVASVFPGGPADKAGIKPGDVLLRIEDGQVSVRGLEDIPLLLARMADLPRNQKSRFVYERGGEVHAVQVDVAPLQDSRGEERAFRIGNFSAMDITEPMAFARNYPSASGVLMTSMRAGSPPDAAKPSLRGGDVILEVNGEAVNDLDTLDEILRKNRRSKELSVRFRRGKRDMITVWDMSDKPKRRGSAELAKPWLGVQTQVLTPEVAKAIGLEGKKGYRVTWVLPGKAAARAGIQAGDVITHMRGEALDADSLADAELLKRKIEERQIGEVVPFQVIRNGKELELKVELDETPITSMDVKTAKDELLEYAVRELTYMDRVQQDLDLEKDGLVVGEVTSGGWASIAGLRSGDVLITINDQPIESIRQFKAMAKRVANEKPKRIKIFVRRGRTTAFVFVQPDWQQD